MYAEPDIICVALIHSAAADGGPGLVYVCKDEECLRKRDKSCALDHHVLSLSQNAYAKQAANLYGAGVNVQACGHPCGGIRGEEVCLPCLHPDCIKDERTGTKVRLSVVSLMFSIAQLRALRFFILVLCFLQEDYCNICWVDSIGSAPAIRLDCGHAFHYQCIQDKISKKWSGARITFGTGHWFSSLSFCPRRVVPKEITYRLLDVAWTRLSALSTVQADDISRLAQESASPIHDPVRGRQEESPGATQNGGNGQGILSVFHRSCADGHEWLAQAASLLFHFLLYA